MIKFWIIKLGQFNQKRKEKKIRRWINEFLKIEIEHDIYKNQALSKSAFGVL